MPPRTASREVQAPLHFAARDRLRKRFEFRRLRAQGRRVHTSSFVLQLAPAERDRARLGITVSRQVGNAVRRNRIKRIVREAFRLRRDLFPAGADVVVIAKTGCQAAGTADVIAELERVGTALHAALRRAHGPRSGAAS